MMERPNGIPRMRKPFKYIKRYLLQDLFLGTTTHTKSSWRVLRQNNDDDMGDDDVLPTFQ